MKKTFTINISGTIFHIEEDAYEVLQKYMVALKNYFGIMMRVKKLLQILKQGLPKFLSKNLARKTKW